MQAPDGAHVSRRAFLAAAVASGLTACAAHPQSAPSATPSAAAPPPSATPTPTNSPTPTPTPSPSPSVTPTPTPSPTPAAPTRDEIVSRYSGRIPTQWNSGEWAPMNGLLRRTGSDKVVLTLDCCGGPGGNGVDAGTFDLLRREHIPAVLFLNKRWIEANRAVFDGLAAQPELFEIGNHGTRHCPLSVNGRSQYGERGTRDVGEVYDEIMGNHAFLADLLGRPPRFFRTGTAWYDEVAIDIVHACGETPVGFDVNGDAGTTFSRQQIVRQLNSATPGSIVICHANQPTHATCAGLTDALPQLRDRGIQFATLTGAGA